ncbi:hypothetical protein KP509_38G034600 [Ceratopteris richardii]|uniref:Calnexin n=1 Tax=Ceratopteris richardii TaxID=49495 RepID=A0A8T2Q3V3_CERRI|nr:hypothetical protein KP509_38G034600 [Ceratopteris richardii]
MNRTGFFVLLACHLVACLAEPIFYESFEESWEGRWLPSEKEDYQGVWKHEKSEGHNNYGLLASEKAKKYGIATTLPKVVHFEDKPVVLQYELRLQNGIECGGSYLKFLQVQEDGWTPEQLDNESPYSIMFGPDKCGATNKVHFIFRHKHPKTGLYKEHHLKFPPAIMNDKLTHVYTAVIHPNNKVSILIDGEEKKSADLLSDDFEPPVLPPQTIKDPEDKKPEDWDERAKIPDPDASKPEDWDEDAPYEIEDIEAEKPEGWLDDEPEEIDDEEAVKPEDWDDEEDGAWEVPKVPNPKCIDGPGCGEWKRPMKKNPAYKGKWYAAMIDNPAYKGIWKARDIPNPDYFHLVKPSLEPISAVGIEIWTMQDGILFDNILVTNDEELGKHYRDTEWKVKFDLEKAEQKKEEEKDVAAGSAALPKLQSHVFKFLRKVAYLPILASQREKIMDFIEKGEERPEVTLSVLGGACVLLLIVIFRFLCSGKKTSTKDDVGKAKKEDITPADDPIPDKGKGKEEENK